MCHKLHEGYQIYANRITTVRNVQKPLQLDLGYQCLHRDFGNQISSNHSETDFQNTYDYGILWYECIQCINNFINEN